MLRGFLLILEKYGLGVANLIFLAWVSYKLFANHLTHLKKSIEENGKIIHRVGTKVDELAERISTVEGKLD